MMELIVDIMNKGAKRGRSIKKADSQVEPEEQEPQEEVKLLERPMS